MHHVGFTYNQLKKEWDKSPPAFNQSCWLSKRVQFLIFMNAKSVKRMTWRQQSEGLDALCTPKGSHIGTSGRIAHFIVAISFNKGLVLCEQYF